MFRLSNNLIGVLNLLTFLLSVPVLGGGVWLATRGGGSGTECERFLTVPLIVLGAFLMLVSLAGLVGACCRASLLLWLYLVAMFLLILLLFAFTLFAFLVTNKGAGEAVSNRGFKEYRLGDYSHWLQKRVDNSKNWAKIRSCLQDSKICERLQQGNETFDQFIRDNLSPIQSGCCKPPTECDFTYVSPTVWTVNSTTLTSTNNTDCSAWNNDPSTLCYGCQSCKAGVLANIKKDWKKVAIINIVVLVFLIMVYSVGCCAFRNIRRDNAYGYGGWKGRYP
ncbi:tetraspanin-8 [Ananas comosus]|uniref:Tetraspanin-7 n=1 Tax=Ananas comosus TaxID=4615 RepID=A0A199V3L3_ANACO|nr:tetraspanin-8 [Ananas comosus]OAY71563.1 Tetraspanin-7 [Ananas comosus]